MSLGTTSSVSLCVLRIEISDNAPDLKHLEYRAPKCVLNMASNNSSTETSDKDAEPKGKEGKKLSARKSRGNRIVRDISVDTFVREEESDMSSQSLTPSVGSSKESTPQPASKEEFTKTRSTLGCPPADSNWSKENSPALGELLDPRKPTDQISFFSGNPFNEITRGILHLFKENEMTPMDDSKPRSETVCLLAVPASMTCHDLLQFTAPCHPDVEYLRIIRDGTPNQYMVIIKYRTQQAADEFYKTYNGAPYNSLEPDVCHVVYISRVETMRESDGASLPMSGHTELPTCPVCLERMDESVDGILTILCNHSFHGSCLAQWGDTSCPVCRYVQTPEVVADNRCFECHVSESLWICLICGHVGCGRYIEGHAYKHYLETEHCFAMQLGNNRVWDYVGDNFVHRLLQNKSDGKLVEVENGMGVPPAKAQEMESDEKLDCLQLEFTYLLTSQLESQRLYFEEKLAHIEQECLVERDELKTRMRNARDETQALQEKLASLAKERQSQEKKMNQLSARFSRALSELQEERQMNESLQQNQSAWQKKVSELEVQLASIKDDKEKEVADLSEQLRDLMFYLEAQQKIAQSPDCKEIAEGQIVIGDPSSGSSQSGAKGPRKRRGR